jgi:hypothetical protein
MRLDVRAREQRSLRGRGQALVELALVMPLLIGIVAVLFQFGILFITYLALVNMGRDVDRWMAVHPDTTDLALVQHVTQDLPNSVMFPGEVDGPNARCTYSSGWTCTSNAVSNPTLASGGLVVQTSGWTSSGGPYYGCGASAAPCTNRAVGYPLQVQVTYDAASRFFLPMNFRFGFLNVPFGSQITTQTYTITMMVEQH